MHFVPGQWVVVRGKAMGRIRSATDHSVTVEEADLRPEEKSTFEIPLEHVAEAIRPLVNPADAQRLLEEMHAVTERPAHPPDERALAYRRALRSGILEDQARELAGIYRGPIEPPEAQYQLFLERAVLGEIARALGGSRKLLAARLRNTAPPRWMGLPDRAAEVAAAKPPALTGYRAFGALAIDTRVAVGEGHPAVAVDAEPGIWFVYVREDEDFFVEALALHEGVINDCEQLVAVATCRGEASIHGARLWVFEETIADDGELVDDILASCEGVLNARVAQFGLGGDGSAFVYVAERNHRAVLVRAVMRDYMDDDE